MDSGLGVRWPLSPYSTALAAGALFAFCLALWKHRFGTRKRARKDPKGQHFGKDLDPTKEQDVSDKPGKEKNEGEADKPKNFPVLTLRDSRRVFSYEQLCVSGQFGAIPRTQQRRQSLESPNLYSAFRRRSVKKEKKNWPEFNPASSYIYQQPFCFGSEIPRLSAKLLLNISPNLNSYFNQVKEVPLPGISRKSCFDDFDVSIKPEILKNKPITRSAVCLALERQLHKFLDEPFHEVKLIERAIQTIEENGNRAPADNTNERDLNSDSDGYDNVGLQPDSSESEKKTSADSSLWDSGYGEKAFEERSNTPRDYTKDDKIEECSGESSDEPSIISDNLVSCSYFSDNTLVTSDSKTLNNCDINTCSESEDKSDKSNALTNKLDSENSDVEIIYEEILTKTLNICDMNTCLESEDKSDKSNTQTNTSKLDFQNSDVEILYKEIGNSTVEENSNILNVSECLDENLLKCSEEIHVGSSEENIFTGTDNPAHGSKTLNICDINTCPESEDNLDELNTQTNKLDFQNSDAEILYKEIENSTVEENINILGVSECLEENLWKCSEEIYVGSNEENKFPGSDNPADDSKTLKMCDLNICPESEDKRNELNTQTNKLDFQNSDAEILYKEIENSTVEENTNILGVSECLDENLLKCSEEIYVGSSEENKFPGSDNPADDSKTLKICDLNICPESEDKRNELNTQTIELDFQTSDVEFFYKETKDSNVEKNTNGLSVSKCLEEDLLKCREEEMQGSSKEENIFSGTNNSHDVSKTLNICDLNTCSESEDNRDELNTEANKLDYQNSDVEILYKEIENSTVEENTTILDVSECLDENLLKCSEEMLGDSNEENILRSTNNPTDSTTQNICGINTCPKSENMSDESNIQTKKLDFENSDVEILFKEIEKSTVEENRNILIVSECLDDILVKCSEEMQVGSSEENILRVTDNSLDIHLDSDRESTVATDALNSAKSKMQQPIESLTFGSSDLEEFQNEFPIFPEERQESRDENFFRVNMPIEEKNLDCPTRAREVDAGGDSDKKDESSIKEEGNSDLEGIQKAFDTTEERNNNNAALSAAPSEAKLSRKRNNSRLTETPGGDVTEGGSSRDSAVFDERGTFNVPRQMDRETGERSVAVESTVTTETTFRANGDARLSTAVVSRLTLDDWSACSTGVSQGEEENSVSVQTTVSEDLFRPTFEEFVPLKSGEKISKSEAGEPLLEEAFVPRNGTEEEKFEDVGSSPSSPRVDRLKGLLSRDEERRARTKFHHLADGSHVGGAMEGEWDRLLRDVLASVSELERWERRHCDVSGDAEDAEQQRHHFSQSDSSFTMEEEALSPNKGETPTKVKNLRFKLDPDVFDVPSDDSFYDDDDDETRRVWKKQSRYRAFSSLELHDEPVRLVSVHASVVPAGQKMVARPVGIDLRVRLTEERQSKRAHVSTSPSQAKRRSPVSDRGIGWCQELSPVTENVDWRETFTPVTPECKSVPNGILKTPSPKMDPSPIESPNPFKLENGVTTNGVSPVIENKSVEKPKYNGWKPVERKPFLLPRKKFEPDPEAVERITGYKSALSKPPLPPPIPSKLNASLIVRNRAEQARKQYLDTKAALSANKVDGTKKFQQFLNQAQNDRARIITSVPDLAAIERAVTEQWTKERGSVSPRESPGREDNKKNDGVTLSRGSTPDDKWASYVQSCRQHLGRRSQSMTYLETDIDIIPVLDDDDKCHSTSALDEPDEALPDPDDSDLDRSREDLDDSGRAKSEHELRIERSLRSLPIPDWYRQSEKTKTGFLLGSSNKEKRGWAAAKSLASSTSSLASCGLRRPVRSLRSSRENIPWSRSSASPDGPTLSLALAKAFREPYLGWRARTPTSSGVSSSPRASPPSWGATTTDDEANGVSFDGEDAFGRTTSSEEDRRDEPLSLDDTGADAVTVSMDTNDPVKLPGGEDTCDDINNMSMDTCELFDASVVVPVDEDPSPQADTGDDIDNLSTDTTTTEGRKLDPKLKRYSYSQSIYHSEWDEEEESRGDRKGKEEDREPSPSSPDHKVVWIESSFVGSRTTTSIVVLPEKRAQGSTQERPASR